MENVGDAKKSQKHVKASSAYWWTGLISYIKRAAHERRAKKQQESTSDRAARHTAVATIWMAIFTVVLAAVSVGTLLMLKNQLTEMHRQTISSENFFRTDERAWVILEVAPLETYPAFDHFPARIKYGFYAKNVGKTIARSVRIRVDSLYDADGKSAILGPQSLAPGDHSPASAIVAGDAPSNLITTWKGRIDYTDGFNVPHWITFCYSVIDAKGTLEQCQTGNDEDQNPN